MPYALALAVDMLVDADDMETLRAIIAPLEPLTPGQRFRLLEGQLRRAYAHLSAEPVDGLRDAVDTFDSMGAAFWAARTRVELATALADVGDNAGAATALAAAEPMLRENNATRALRQVDVLHTRIGDQAVAVPTQPVG